MPGLGLGFFIAKTLLARAGAKISLENKRFPQRGAIVRVRWKRADFERQVTWTKDVEAPVETASDEKMPASPLVENP